MAKTIGVQVRLMGEDVEAVRAARQRLEGLYGVIFTGEAPLRRGVGTRVYGTITTAIDAECDTLTDGNKVTTIKRVRYG